MVSVAWLLFFPVHGLMCTCSASLLTLFTRSEFSTCLLSLPVFPVAHSSLENFLLITSEVSIVDLRSPIFSACSVVWLPVCLELEEHGCYRSVLWCIAIAEYFERDLQEEKWKSGLKCLGRACVGSWGDFRSALKCIDIALMGGWDGAGQDWIAGDASGLDFGTLTELSECSRRKD